MFEENKQICRRLFEEAYGKGNLKTVDDDVSPNCRLHDPVFPSLAPGADSLKRHIREIRNAFPDLSFTCDDIIAERDEVVIHWTCRGTQRAEFLSFPATHRTATVSGTTIHRIEGGQIVEFWSDWNVQSLLDQLGLGMTEQEANKALVRRLVEEVWNRKKPEMIAQLVAGDYVLTSPNGAQHGVSGMRQEYDNLVTAFPDCHIQLDEITCEGHRVVTRSTLTGTHTGKLLEIAPSGKSIKLPAMSMLRIANGKVVEHHLVFDRLNLLQQIGAVPESVAAATRARK